MSDSESYEACNVNDCATKAFAEAGKAFGFKDVATEFVCFRDFKVKWKRSERWAEFEISDYMKDAPENVLRELATTIFSKINGEDKDYSETVKSWLTTKTFVKDNQPIYLRRNAAFKEPGFFEYKDLEQSRKRLIEKGLIEDDPDICCRWIRSERSCRVAKSSVLMKVIGISTKLDHPDIPDELLDYCLYSQIARVNMGFDPGEDTWEEYEEILSEFPNRGEMENQLEELQMYL